VLRWFQTGAALARTIIDATEFMHLSTSYALRSPNPRARAW